MQDRKRPARRASNGFATRLLIGLASFVMMLGYQNCGADFVPMSEKQLVSLGKIVCGADLAETFGKTYYPFFVSNCASCHGNGRGPQFATGVLGTSYVAFSTMTDASMAKLRDNAISGTHQGAGGGHLTDAFSKAESDFNSCKPKTDGGQSGVITARTTPFTLNATAITALKTIDALDTKLEIGQTALGAGTRLHFRVQTVVSGSDSVYYIAQPSLQTGTNAIVVRGIYVKINGVDLNPSAQAFRQVDKVIAANQNPVNGNNLNGNLSAGTAAFIIPGGAKPTDTVQFEFELLKAE